MTRAGRLVIAAAMVLSTLVLVVWLMSPMLPLGVPGEWGWSPLYWTGAHPFAWISNLCFAAAGTGVIGWASRRLPADPGAATTRRRRMTVSVVATAVAVGWWLNLLGSIPSPFGLARSPLVLFYPRMTGYYTAARYSPEGTGDFLQGYEKMLRELKGPERYLHIGTHPPGLIVLCRMAWGATSASPSLVRLLEATMPEPVHEANATIRAESVLSGREFTPQDGAALWLLTVLTMVSAGACIPLLGVIVRSSGHSERSAARWSAVWMFTPAVAVFLPKDDVLFPFASLVAGVLWLRALELDSRWRAAAAGVACFAGMMCSLAFLPVMLWLVIVTLWRWWGEGGTSRLGEVPVRTVKPRAGALAAGLAGFLVPLFVLGVGFGADIAAIWRLNFENHAEFYEHNDRSYGKWLIANIGELLWGAGPAVCVLAAAAVLLRSRPNGRNDWRPIPGMAGLIVLSVLWISGKNMGEAARLWILFLPWLLLCLPPIRGEGEDAAGRGAPAWLWWLTAGLQAVACIAAATQIDGFGLTELE